MCPQCNAPLTPHRFARSVVCSYCGATVQLEEGVVSAAVFQAAFRAWNSPESYGVPSWISIGESHWALDQLISHGAISDVYTGQRARWPTELTIVKLLRNQQDSALFENEWKILQLLQHSEAQGADTFGRLIPQPVLHGNITAGSYAGKNVSIFRWASGFYHTFDEIIQVYPQGIDPQASIWVWRRILEMLSFLHNSGIVHGAVFPSHLLAQENEHGVRIVGYSSAGHFGEKLNSISHYYESFYPQPAQSSLILTPQLDLVMSARCIMVILGGNLETGSLPSTVPDQLAQIVKRIALKVTVDSTKENAWAIREELGDIAKIAYGPPRFIPIVMPS